MHGAAEFWRTLANCLEAGENVFLALVAENTRHSPGTVGARMLLSETGQRAGTVGGGIMEYTLLKRAAEILGKGTISPEGGDESMLAPEIRVLHHQKSPAAGDPSGMICAGSQTNLYSLCRPESELDVIQRVASMVEEGRSGTLSISPLGLAVEDAEPELSRSQIALERNEDGWRYVEQLLNRKRLAILGGGHCALALAGTMHRLGYDVFVFETRKNVFEDELEQWTRSVRIVDDFRLAGPLIDYPELTWVVVMTTDFPSDVRALSGVVARPFRFIGAMGAPAKIEKIMQRLGEDGVSPAVLKRIHAPVGLPIPSHTPEEIAICIAAQIMQLQAVDPTTAAGSLRATMR